MILPPLTLGRILKRYKRFLADIELEDGRVVVAHCPNTGAMTSCWKPGSPVQISYNDNPKRKLRWTLERIDMGFGWIGVNTNSVNGIIAQWIENQMIPALTHYSEVKREPAYHAPGYPKSRFDLLCTHSTLADCFIEIKNTTLLVGDSIQFPDAVTERGRKHLDLLAHAVKQGHRGIICYALNRPEGEFFEPAAHIDPAYANTLERVIDNGVEILLVRLYHSDTAIEYRGSLIHAK